MNEGMGVLILTLSSLDLWMFLSQPRKEPIR